MIILGIDPGTSDTGYGLIRVTGRNGTTNLNAIKWGIIKTSKERSPQKRLQTIHEQMNLLIYKYKPDVLAIEKIFFASNAKTAIRVGQAQGVMLLSAATYDTEVYEYAPPTIKKLVTGDGRADKKQIQKSLRAVFGAKVRSPKHKKTHFDNAADGLAVALCHHYKVINTENGKD